MAITRRQFMTYLGSAASASILAPWSGVSQAAENTNVIVVVVDTMRKDHLTMQDYIRDTSPNLSRLAETSVMFSNAYTAASWTYPSFGSILTGKHAFNHNLNTASTLIPPDSMMLPELFNTTDYKTVSIQTNAFINYLDYDFDTRIDLAYLDTELIDADALNKATLWLETNRNEKFFMFLGLFSPHWGYSAAPIFFKDFVKDQTFMNSAPSVEELLTSREKLITYESLSPDLQTYLGMPKLGPYYLDSRIYTAAYDSDIKFADAQLGKLLNYLGSLGLFDSSMIIVTADHGEHMTDHGQLFDHGVSLYNALISTPLIIKLPYQQERMVIDNNVSNIDILPTVLDYLEIDIPEDIDGKSLLPLIFDQDSIDSSDPVFAYRRSLFEESSSEIAVVSDEYKLIRGPVQDELFNLNLDPDELDNIADLNPDIVESLKLNIDEVYGEQ